MSDPVIIVCAADVRFAMPLAVTLRSAAANCSRRVQAYVLNDDLPLDAKRDIERVCMRQPRPPTISWLDAEREYLRDLPVGMSHLSRATYLRLAIGRLLSADVNRILYLDSDVLVLGDVADLWDTPLENNVIGAVRDFGTQRSGQQDALGYCIEACGMDGSRPLFNAGVLLMDLEAYREQRIEEQCIDFLRRWQANIRSADQDALNAVLHDRWKALHFRWNTQVGPLAVFSRAGSLSPQEEASLADLHPAILHFSGSCKPWNSGLRSAPCRQYVRSVRESGWYGAAGFRLWQAKRMAVCVHSAAVNRFAAMRFNRVHNPGVQAAGA
ncbi:MAG: glycosyltransferase family 8 protein [Tepidisphaeraceae bacterium]